MVWFRRKKQPTQEHRQPAVPPSRRLELLRDIHLKAGDIVIDCGANIGQEVKLFVDSQAIIHAFEPNPHAFAALVKRFGDHPNVHCYQQAVLDRVDTVRLYMHEFSHEDEVKWSVGSSILEYKSNIVDDRYVDVPTIDLSEFVDSLQQPVKLLKMDIEGAEYATLTKLIERKLTDRIEQILVETHAERIPELQEAHQALVELIRSEKIQNIDLNWI